MRCCKIWPESSLEKHKKSLSSRFTSSNLGFYQQGERKPDIAITKQYLWQGILNKGEEKNMETTVENEELRKQLSNAGIFISQLKKERAFLQEQKEDIKNIYN